MSARLSLDLVRCPHCGHQHYSTICHVCKTPAGTIVFPAAGGDIGRITHALTPVGLIELHKDIK